MPEQKILYHLYPEFFVLPVSRPKLGSESSAAPVMWERRTSVKKRFKIIWKVSKKKKHLSWSHNGTEISFKTTECSESARIFLVAIMAHGHIGNNFWDLDDDDDVDNDWDGNAIMAAT